MSVINNPPISNVPQLMATWFTQVYTICFSVQESGVTTDRPIKNLWIGRRYYDTTLNKPIYISAVNPTVWRDSQGAIV